MEYFEKCSITDANARESKTAFCLSVVRKEAYAFVTTWRWTHLIVLNTLPEYLDNS